MTDSYRIEYVIQRRRESEDDFAEIGFGSSGEWGSLNACTHMLDSAISNQEWETEGDQPHPSTIDPTGRAYPPVMPGDADE